MLWTSTGETIHHASGEIHTCHAAIDTAKWFFPPFLKREQLQRLKALQKLLPPKGKHHRVLLRRGKWGWHLTLQQPTIAVLQQLDPMVHEFKGVLTRVDIALYYSGGDLTKLRSGIPLHMMLRWRRRQPMHDIRATTYWCKEGGKRPPPRNLTTYSDRPNKVTGEAECVKLELRFLRAYAIRANQVHSISDLMTLNPHDLFNRHVKWANVSETFVQKIVRNEVNKDRKRYQGIVTKQGVDRYRGTIRRSASNVLRRNLRVQILRDSSNPRTTIKSGTIPLTIPTALTFSTH
jgi:hypothetical protein